jgi:Uma2 family endonuclease
MSDLSKLRFASVGPFLDWHERQERRYELVGGWPMMQAGASRGHERIAKNVVRELEKQIDLTHLDVNRADFALQVGTEDDGQPIVRYPDVVVDEQTGDDTDRIATNPVLVIEVLSRSTEKVDLEVKPQEYGSVPSIQAYVVFDGNACVAQIWRRDGQGIWPQHPERIERGAVRVAKLKVALNLAAVFSATGSDSGQTSIFD